MAVGALGEQEHGASSAVCGSPRSERDQDLDLRKLDGLPVKESLALVREVLDGDLRPERLYLSLHADVVETHPEEVIKVLEKVKFSLRDVVIVQDSLSDSSAVQDVLGAVVLLPLKRLRLFSPRDCGSRGARLFSSFSRTITAGLTSLDLRSSGTYFSLACRKLLSIHWESLRQVRLNDRPSWFVVRQLQRCQGVQSLGLPDLRLLSRLDPFLPNVREVLVTSTSPARRRRLHVTRGVILHSSIMQKVTHISLEDRFCSDIPCLAMVCQHLKTLTLRNYSSAKLNWVKKFLKQFVALKHIRLFHCEVPQDFDQDLRSHGITVEGIANRQSSQGVFRRLCNFKECDCCMEGAADVSFSKLTKDTSNILQQLKEEVDTVEKRHFLERDTIKQAGNSLWVQKKRFRLTASNFAAVCKRRDSTFCHNLVKRLAFPPSLDHVEAVRWGRSREHEAKKTYRLSTGNYVQECGLFVREDLPFLAASPDGLVGDDGLVEVKTYPTVAMTLEEALYDPRLMRKLPVWFVETEMGPTLQILRNHSFHYQIQGQLAICRREWCDLILHGLHDQLVVRVWRDEGFWSEMLPKLLRFYTQCLLPEFADSRILRGLPVREPQFVLTAIDEAKKRQKARRPKQGIVAPFQNAFTYYCPLVMNQFGNIAAF